MYVFSSWLLQIFRLQGTVAGKLSANVRVFLAILAAG